MAGVDLKRLGPRPTEPPASSRPGPLAADTDVGDHRVGGAVIGAINGPASGAGLAVAACL